MPMQRKKIGKEELRKIVEMCTAIEAKGLNPFLADVEDLVTVIKEYFPEWEKPDELCLDAEALNKIATIIKLQSEWLKNRATSLYADPFLIEEKIHTLSVDEVASIFLESWHPVVELEQISLHSLSESLRYWNSLLPLDERWKSIGFEEKETQTATREEMIEQRVLSGEAFSGKLESLWGELKRKAGGVGKVRYWDFVMSDTYEGTIERAYLTSFLVTYRYATLEIHPLEEEIFIRPFEKLLSTRESEQLISVPIPIAYEEWVQWRERLGASSGKHIMQ